MSRNGTCAFLVFFTASALTGCSSNKASVLADQDKLPSGIEEEIVLSPRDKESPTAKMCTDFAHFFADVGNYERSVELFRDAIKADKKDPQPYVGLAKIYTRMDHPDEALRILQDGAKQCKRSHEIWNEIGVVYGTQRKYGEAIKALETSLKYAPDRPLYIENYAGLLAAAGEYERSYQNYARLLPPSEARYRVAGIAYDSGNREQSETQLRLAIQENPGHRNSLAMLERLAGAEINQVGYLVEERVHGLESSHRK